MRHLAAWPGNRRLLASNLGAFSPRRHEEFDREWLMAKAQRMTRQLGWLLACLWIAGAGCDDDSAADAGEHGPHAHDADNAHGGAGSGETEHDHTKMIGDLTGAECPSDSTLTYESFGKKFMTDYCLHCHSKSVKDAARNGAPGDHNFDSLAEIDLLKEHIDQYAGSGPKATNTKMPAADPKPSKEEREKLSQWIACGTPE
jgi:hypothetical protein